MRELLIQTADRTKVVDAEALRAYLDENTNGRRVDEVLLSSPNFREDMILRLFAEALGMPYIEELSTETVPREFVEKVPASYAQHHSLIGYRKGEGEPITVVVCRPLNTAAVDNVSKMLNEPVDCALASRTNITAAIDDAYQQKDTVIEEVAEELEEQNLDQLVDEVASSDDLLDVVNRPPVIRLVNDVLFRALQLRASDIHIHPFETKIQVRYRIDGILYDTLSLHRNTLSLIISRIKVMAGMDIAERRMPQDGRCSVRLGQREIDLRVSTVPTSFGERAVLRILDKSSGIFSLDMLGLWEDDLKLFNSMINRSHGVFFVTGPTGSGKSTTLYAALNQIDSVQKNIMTVEDPIEYQLSGISQMQVASKKGVTFVNALRHILRQDPDVIMVGETRDQETASMCIQSSLTGHLVFSTLHTNDAAGTVSRLLDFGVEPYLVSSSLIGVMAQRLVRRTCDNCKKEYVPSEDELRELSLEQVPDKFYEGAGCEKCFNTGYRGRVGIFELMMITEDIREMVYRRETAGAIKKVAIASGMKTLRMDGARKAGRGLTTIAEIFRVTQSDV